MHYKELEYLQSPLTAAESLVHICNQLRLPDAAQGILNYTMANVPGAAEKISANWYEKLCMYSTSLGLYRKQLDVRSVHALLLTACSYKCTRPAQITRVSLFNSLLPTHLCQAPIGCFICLRSSVCTTMHARCNGSLQLAMRMSHVLGRATAATAGGGAGVPPAHACALGEHDGRDAMSCVYR